MSGNQTEAGGATFRFSALTGEVIDTQQRSDSYTTGSSRTVVVDGYGGGGGHVSTNVVVSRDIWLRTASGDEHHVRVQADLPIRIGQRIAVISLRVAKPSNNRTYDGIVSVYAPATDTYWTVKKLDAIARLLPLPNWPKIGYQAWGLLWLASLAACLVGIGIPIVIALGVRQWRENRRCSRETAAILAAFQAEHQALIRHEHDDWRREADRLRKPDGARPAIGAVE